VKEKQLSQKQIGKRLALLRKASGLSQEELAKIISMSRSSLAQIETGKRKIDIFELQEFSKVLGFRIDDLFATEVHEPDQKASTKILSAADTGLRISIPEINMEKFRNILLYILEQCSGKPNIGETVLNKLLYFCDFNYYELYEEHLTGARYRKLPYGPVPRELNAMINQMLENGQLKRIKTNYHGYIQIRYLPLEKADIAKISAAEITVINRVIQQMSDWNANALTDYSHKDIPWVATAEGEDINYNLAFYRVLPYSVRNYDNDTD